MAHVTATADLPARAGDRSLLRVALKLDAVVSAANGAAYLAAAGPLADLLGVSAAALRGAGAFVLVYAAAVWVVATRPVVPHGGARAIIAGNLVWALAGVGAAVAGWESPTTAGTVWIVVQALLVGALAELQLVGLRRDRRR